MADQQSPDVTAAVAERRPRYLAEIAAGVERFFEPRRADCPWCGSDRLSVRLRTTDLLQHKPGRFILEQCGECAHIFQNPRLNGDGLEFYYRDIYDGLGEAKMNSMFEASARGYRSRAEMISPHHTPVCWLDVGMGHGHFCREAKEVHPDTVFDGLDISAGVELAQERGWVRKAYRGDFVDRSVDLAGEYDVISMFHYLEHTADPRAEVAAAAAALPPGGYLLIELPDPECRWNRLVGRYWMPWLQPQHLNMIPLRNLRRAAIDSGLTPVAEQRSEAHESSDLVAALYLLLASKFSDDDRPWHEAPPSAARKRLCTVVWLLAVPALLVAMLIDKAVAPIGRDRGMSNAYRFLATKPG
ncbi:methyltransferase type 12 [Amycolatopsis antarctica]|uniref:Methyltransferase type 12 n=1 Tax=Amycolatopsis antarctica TaxID=1854586 RepID=A0A263D1M4_9PSEU|nr:class I SAM-dependent methyltransferase [Amycolatopsis antarctica]OZM72099.1 methyltransferase type 12 [Amycolatopsis antarctica]